MIELNWYKTTTDKLESLPNDSGLYIISVLLKSENYGVVYVGQSIDIRERVIKHFSNYESNEELKSYLKNNYKFKVSYCKASLSKLDGLEKYLIYVYDPRFNKKEGNGDISYKCSLPNVIKW